MVDYFVRIAAWMSQEINCIFLFGSENQTVSSRAYANRKTPKWGYVYRLLNKVFFFQSDHCKASYTSDLNFSKKFY